MADVFEAESECAKKTVVTAEAAAECCEEALGGTKQLLIRVGENVIQAIDRAIAEQRFESSFQATEAILTQFVANGFQSPPDVASALEWNVAGFMQNSSFRVEPLQSGRVVINEQHSGSPYAPGVSTARAAGIAGALMLATQLLTAVQKSRKTTTRGKTSTACCGCVLAKLLSQAKPLSSAAPDARRRRVPTTP